MCYWVGLGRAWTRPDPRPDPRVFWETRTRPAPFLVDPRQTRAKFLGPETHFSSQNPYLAQICMIFWEKYGPEVDPSKFFRTRDPTLAFLNGPRPDPSQKKETRPSPTTECWHILEQFCSSVWISSLPSCSKHLPRKFNDVSEWVSRYQFALAFKCPLQEKRPECTL